MLKAKFVYLAKRHPSLTREQWPARWLQHSFFPRPGRSRLIEFDGVVYGVIDGESEYDGVALISIKGLQSIPTAIATAKAPSPTLDDEYETFSTRVIDFTVHCAVDQVLDGPRTKFAVVRFLKKPDSASPTESYTAWLADSEALAKPGVLPGAPTRWARNLVVAPQPAGYEFSGVEEFWFETQAQAQAAAAMLRARTNAAFDVAHAFSLSIINDKPPPQPEAAAPPA